ncbi:MAG TPA: hypothetical protein ENK57_05240 [Polyangiaceae bacterium]|nr:hypothetical protein [Polyangiaceae bacterium]
MVPSMLRRATLLASLLSLAPACDRPSPPALGAASARASSDALPDGAQQVSIKATAKGFEPAEVHVEQGRPAVLTFTRVVESSCVDAVKMPWRDEAYDLPLNQAVNVVIPDTSKAGSFSYSCWMDMVHGRVTVDPASAP